MGKYTAFKLPLKSLGVGTHEFEYHLDKQFFVNMESSDIHDADLSVHLTVQYNGDIYNLDFHITGEVVLICDRCLDDLPLPHHRKLPHRGEIWRGLHRRPRTRGSKFP